MSRLEAPGRYYDGEQARPLEVMVSFGERSLVILGVDGMAEAHWPLATLRAVSQKGEPRIRLVPDLGSDERLVIDDHPMISAIERKCPRLRRIPANRRGMGKALVMLGAALGSVALIVLVIIPSLATQIAPLIPPEQEARLGDAVAGQIRSVMSFSGDREVGFCQAPRGVAALDKMTARLEPTAELPAGLRVSVLDHELTNAFAAPGGRIVIFRGLIDEAESPEEVAGVLAHEMGHVLYRDPTVGVLRSAGTAGILGMMVGDVFGAAIVIAGSEAVMSASYQRDVEARADEAALEMLREAGLPSNPFAGFFRRLAERYGDMDEGVLSYLSSHPALEARAEAASSGDTVGTTAFKPVLTDSEWLALRRICARTSDEMRN